MNRKLRRNKANRDTIRDIESKGHIFRPMSRAQAEARRAAMPKINIADVRKRAREISREVKHE